MDGVAATASGGTHTFRTPELAKGKPFVYDFRAEVDQADGKTDVINKKVTFIAGDPVVVDFTDAPAVRTASRAQAPIEPSPEIRPRPMSIREMP